MVKQASFRGKISSTIRVTTNIYYSTCHGNKYNTLSEHLCGTKKVTTDQQKSYIIGTTGPKKLQRVTTETIKVTMIGLQRRRCNFEIVVVT